MSTRRLRRVPRLLPLLARGALVGLGKRPGGHARLPGTTLVLPSLRADRERVAAYARLCGFVRAAATDLPAKTDPPATAPRSRRVPHPARGVTAPPAPPRPTTPTPSAPDQPPPSPTAPSLTAPATPVAPAVPTAPAAPTAPSAPAAPASLAGPAAPGRPVRPPDALPLTYPHVLGFPLAVRLMSERAFPLPVVGLVHTAIEIVQYVPPRPDDDHEVRVYAEGLVPHRRGTEVAVVTELRRYGRTLWRDRSTYLARHPTPRTGPPPAPARAALAPRPTSYPARPALPPRPIWPALPDGGGAPGGSGPGAAGHLPVRGQWRLPADLGRRHAAVSGDYNPLHLSRLTARPLGFPRAVAHGMWTLARCVAEAVDPNRPRVRVRARFHRPVLLPSTVRYCSDGTRFALCGEPGTARPHLEGEVHYW